MWDVRANCRYYYRHARREGRPVRVYIGTGLEAENAAIADDQRRFIRQQQLERRHSEQAKWDDAVTALENLVKNFDLLANAALTAKGYYRHDYGSWRRRVTHRKGYRQSS